MWKYRNIIQIRKYSESINNTLINLLKTMPKDPKHIVDAQKQRKKIKEKFSKFVPGRVTLQVLGTGANGAPSTLYVFSDQSRYLFNCGEGTQRLAHEHKMKLAKLEHIFFTRTTWNNIGGLPGAALTIQDVGVPQITLHGPPGLDEIFVATRRFVVIKDLDIRVAQCRENDVFEDNVMQVRYVPLYDGNSAFKCRNGTAEIDSESIDEDDTDYYAYESSGQRKAPERVSENSKLVLQEVQQKRTSLAYICRLQPRPGALCLDKCVKLGVPPGPLLGKLKSGQDVTLANGNIVKASDVCDPDDRGPVFIIIDCPTEDYLDSLINNEEFRKYQSSAKNDDDLAYLVVHFSPKRIVDNIKYKEWIDRFSPSTQHLILNENNKCMGSLSVHRIQHKLNLLSNNIFPLLGDKGTEIIAEQSTLPAVKKIKSENQLEQQLPIGNLTVELDPYIYPNSLYNHHLRPKKGIDRSVELKLIPSEFVEETMIIENFPQILQDVKQQVHQKTNGQMMKIFPRLLFLGTGSSIPNKTRNTSGILFEIGANSKILMDCGEGTYGQIVRFYGQNKCDRILANVKAIYISHLHADHHLGLIGMLQGRRRAFENLNQTGVPLILFAPKQIQCWLSFYHRYYENIESEFQLVANSDFLLNNHQLEKDGENSIYQRLDVKEINTCFVRHCPNAFGISFTDNNGYKITYSGDTMPSENLVELGRNSDLLIHEATMEDELAEEAVIKMHSTTSQAIEAGNKMNAKYTLLTHFSQRYAKLPRFNDNFADNVGIAFDNMQVRLDELPLVPILYPALKLMFAEHYEELEHKAVKRQIRIEREKELVRDKIAVEKS